MNFALNRVLCPLPYFVFTNFKTRLIVLQETVEKRPRTGRLLAKLDRRLAEAEGLTPRRLPRFVVWRTKVLFATKGSGASLDLAARALVAFEHQTPVKQSAEDLSESLKDQYGQLLKYCNLPKDPLDINDWEEEVMK